MIGTLIAFGALGLPALAYAAYRRITRGEWLPYEPRWPVPWGAVGGVMALSLVALGVLSLFAPAPAVDKTAATLVDQSPADFLNTALVYVALQLGMVAALAFLVRHATHATLTDMGLPRDRRTLARDLGLGAVAALGALIPVYFVQGLLVLGLRLETSHPTLTRIQSDPDPRILIAAALTACIAAPVFEEFVFRLMLQGWLEKVEDESLAFGGRMEWDEKQEEQPEPTGPDAAVEAALGDPDSPLTPEQFLWLRRLRRRRGSPPRPPVWSYGGIPHGWGPVLASSFAFAAVHVGQGVAPIPLFFFALVLGYLYQRTHRLTPSIAAHVVFNSASLVAARLAG